MVKDLSPAELSALWLLHDRHTNRHAVEKAIELGLPLWTEAVHLARACHRSNMDLAGGTFYIVGSDFVDNEDSSQYDYHEKGRYPNAYTNNASSIVQESRLKEKERVASNNDARSRFESEKSKHIQLLLGGVSSVELEKFQFKPSSLEICEISDDEEPVGARSHVETLRTPVVENSNNSETKPHPASSIRESVRQPTSKKSLSQEENRPFMGSTVKQSKVTKLKEFRKEREFRYDLSFCDAQILRSCEVSSTASPRSCVLMDRAEFERRLRSENESMKDKKKSSQSKILAAGDSEIEDTRRNTVMEIDNAVSQLAPDLEMNEVISKLMKEDVAAEFSEAGTPTKRSKRHYVEPFDGDESVSESEFSDTNIDVNILYEISELRREEGASSPSSCSIDSDDVIPPDVCIWHPQSCTYNIDLITYFRAPSPCEETVTVLIPKQFVELAVKAPMYEEITSTSSFLKRLPHSGAFTRKRARRSATRSLSLRAAETENVVLDCELNNPEVGSDTCELAVIESCLESTSLTCKASKEVCFLLHCCVTYVKPTYQTCVIERADSHHQSICFKTEAAKDEHCLLDSSVVKENEEVLECSVRKEDSQYCSVFLETKSSSVDSCACQCDFRNDTDFSERCDVICAEYHSEAVFFAAKASTSTDTSCEILLISKPLNEAYAASFTEYLQMETSFICKVPRTTEIRSTQEIVRKTEVGKCSKIMDNFHIEKAMLHCSVPKCEVISSYWLFDIMLGNSAIIELKDKNLWKATHFCKAVYAEKPSSLTSGRKRDDSLNEVILLLETGAMPSQFIETSPPRPLLARKQRSSRRSHVFDQGRVFEEPSTIALNQQEVIVISPEKRPPSLSQPPSGLEERTNAPFSDGSGLSDSPDRLVICDEEDVIAAEDSVNLVGNLGQNSSNVVNIALKPIEPSITGQSRTEKVVSEVTIDEPVRKVLRKRSVPIETTRKRSAGKPERLISTLEPSHTSIKAEQAVRKTLVVEVPTTIQKGRKSVGKVPFPAFPSLPKTSPKKITRKTREIVGKRISTSSLQPAPEKCATVSRKVTMLPATKPCVVTALSERPDLTSGKKERRRNIQHLASSLTVPKRISLPADLQIPSCLRATEKWKSPVFESHRTVISAVFAAIPQTASALTHLPVADRESAFFECCSVPHHEPESRLIQPILNTGLDDIADSVVSAIPGSTSSIIEEHSRVDDIQVDIADISTLGKRRKRKGASPAALVSAKSKRSSGKAETGVASEKRRNLKRLVEPIIPEQMPKKKKGNTTAGPESHVFSPIEKAHADLIQGRALQKENFSVDKSKSRLAALSEKEKIVPAKTSVRSSRRRSAIHPEIPPSSSECITDAAETRTPPELELDTDAILRTAKRRKTITTIKFGRNSATGVKPANNDEAHLGVSTRRKSRRLTTAPPAVTASSSLDEPRRRTLATCASTSLQRTGDEDEVQFVESGFAHRHRRSPTPPILVVAVDFTSSFVPIKRDNNRCAEPITLPACNWGESLSLAIYSSDTAEVLNALALDIIIGEASALSAVNLATFAHFVLNLFDPVGPIFAPLEEIEPSTLPPNFTTIFERATPLQYRHRLDYNSFNSMLLNRLPENGLHALTLDSRRVSMLKITKFVDTVKEAVEDICEELRNRDSLSKAEIKKEIDLSGEVQQLITSRYVETMMKMADACGEVRDVPLVVIADRFHLLLCGWQCFLQQGGVLRVRVQICPGRSHPGIVDITTAWLDKIDTILSRAQATKSMRTAAFAVSLAQEKAVISKVWYQMASHTSSSNEDGTYIYCEECKLYFRNEDTDFIHNRVFHQKSRECEECYDMFHTLLGLDLHMVGCHKRNFAVDL